MNKTYELPEALKAELNVKSATNTPWWWGLWTIMRVGVYESWVGSLFCVNAFRGASFSEIGHGSFT